jgi:transcriptional regulator GlxA family with amidase domain
MCDEASQTANVDQMKLARPFAEETMARVPVQKWPSFLEGGHLTVPERKDVKDPRISGAMEILAKADLGTDIDIAQIATAVNLSRSRFRHLFTKEVGTSPHSYIRFLRMCRARSLLENTFLQVKQVMLMVGYRDPSHFVRDYKNVCLTSPSMARRSVVGHSKHNST